MAASVMVGVIVGERINFEETATCVNSGSDV